MCINNSMVDFVQLINWVYLSFDNFSTMWLGGGGWVGVLQNKIENNIFVFFFSCYKHEI